MVANAEQLVIVTAVADPEPRTGFVDRCLVAAYAGGLTPVLCLTKADLADPGPFAAQYARAGPAGAGDPPRPAAGRSWRSVLAGRVSALVGHSGVGKSTLVNALVPDADRAVGGCPGSARAGTPPSAALALPLPRSAPGWVVDTPGVRSFGLAHVTPDDVLAAFGDLAAAIEDCPRGCGHLGPPADPECALDTLVAAGRLRPARLAALRRVLVALRREPHAPPPPICANGTFAQTYCPNGPFGHGSGGAGAGATGGRAGGCDRVNTRWHPAG